MADALASGDVDTVVSLGCDLSEAGDHVNAARCFQWAVAEGAEWVTCNLGNELVSLDRDGEAIVMYHRAVRAGQTDAWLNLGQALERRGDPRAALDAFEHGHDAGDVNAGLAQAFLLREADRRDEAEQIVQQLADAGSALADAVAACWLFNRTLDPALEQRLREGADLYPSARADLAQLLHDSDRLLEAVEVLQRGTSLGEVESFLPLANLYLDDLDDPATAEALYRAGIDAGDMYCHHNLAALLADQNRLNEAIYHYECAAAAGDALAAQALRQLDADEEQG